MQELLHDYSRKSTRKRYIMNEILLGNCENVLKNVEEESVHLTVTSPPYYNAKEYSHWPEYKDYINFLKNTFKEVYRVTKPGRMCVVNLSPVIEPRKSRSHESRRLAIPFHFFSLMENMGWKYIDDIVWVKPEGASINRNGGFFQHRKPVAYKPNVVTETIFVFQKPSDFLIDKVVRSYEGGILEDSLVADGYERSNVWEINPMTRSKHLAPFPQELSDKIIKYYSYVGDVVLDPFIGSGTTAISCVDLKRQYLGIEIHQEYKDLAEERIQNTHNANI
jgi:DNA modification methylase